MKVLYQNKQIASGLRSKEECTAFIAIFCSRENIHFNSVSFEKKADKEFIRCGKHEFIVMEER